MSNTSTTERKAPRPGVVFGAGVCAALPAAFLTMMADSAGKDPYGFELYLAVLIVPALLGFVADALARKIDGDTTAPLDEISVAGLASFVTSVGAFLAACAWLL